MTENALQMRIHSIGNAADGVCLLDLRPLPGAAALPAFTAGAHIDLQLPSGLLRSYSLANVQHERHRYLVAVGLCDNSRGGSRYLHKVAREGDLITVGAPRNNFPLAEDAPYTVLVAGGIGITPLWSMAQRLQSLGREWELHYACGNRASAAFMPELRALCDSTGARLFTAFSQETNGSRLNLAAIVANAPPGAHLYCCGPASMLDAFALATASRPPHTLHTEHFAAREAPAATGGFSVELARSGRVIEVAPGSSVLAALRDAGIDIPYSCEEGVCGSCEVRVLSGVPDHCDMVLGAAERAANGSMMVCCSGSLSARLVLDL